MKPTYEELLSDPDLLHRVERQARRERSLAIGRCVAKALRALRAAVAARNRLPRNSAPG